MKRSITRQRAILLVLACAVALAAAGAGYARFANAASKPIATKCGTASGGGCAPVDRRIDLAQPRFTNPTAITHPLFPASEVTQTILLGNVDGHPLRVEYTLLPGVKTIAWNGQRVDTRVVQYVAWLDGRIKEVALDWYAQADDGAVWYFGEDVFNYENGVVADTDGSWLAGKDGPAAMIMPAQPQVGAVYRVENIPGRVFEEVTVKAVGLTVAGPRGPVAGAMVGDQLHLDGTRAEKTFAPGYGEFVTGKGGELEAVALAVPPDALPGPAPAELTTLLIGTTTILEAVETGEWNAASATRDRLNAAWAGLRARGVPPLLDAQMNRALATLAGDALAPALDARNPGGSRRGAIAVAQATLDLHLQYRPVAEIDLLRLELWTRQLLVDVAGDDPGATVSGDIVSLEQVRDRVVHTLTGADADRLNAQLGALRTAVDARDFTKVAGAATQLLGALKRLQG